MIIVNYSLNMNIVNNSDDQNAAEKLHSRKILYKYAGITLDSWRYDSTDIEFWERPQGYITSSNNQSINSDDVGTLLQSYYNCRR